MTYQNSGKLKLPSVDFAAADDIATFLSLWLAHNPLEGEAKATLNAYYSNARRAFAARMRRQYRNQIREADIIVTNNPGCRVLEVGCGLGTESLWLAHRGAQVTAIDVRPERIACAQARQTVLEHELGHKLPCTFENVSLMDLEQLSAFDLIWMEQTFHHLEPRALVLDKIPELLRPGGHLVISEANSLNPFLQLQLFFRRGWPRVVTYKSADGRKYAYGDERVVSGKRLKRELASRNINCLTLRHFRIFPNHTLFDSLGKLETCLEGSAPMFLFTHFNYVGQLRGQ